MENTIAYKEARRLYYNTDLNSQASYKGTDVIKVRNGLYTIQRRDKKRFFKTKINNGVLWLKRIL